MDLAVEINGDVALRLQFILVQCVHLTEARKCITTVFLNCVEPNICTTLTPL